MRMFRISRRFSFLFALLPAVSLLAACQSADEDDEGMAADTMAMKSSDASQAIRDLAANYVRHYNLGHADQVAALYVDSAIALLADGTVARGRAEVAQRLAAQMANGSPQVSVSVIDTKTGGDTAVAIGTWRVKRTPEGAAPIEMGGHWMGGYEHQADGWKLMGLITNYDAQQPPEAYQGMAPAEAPPENSRMGSMIDTYVAAWNSGDAVGVAALYAPDAWTAFADNPVNEGREAIQQLLQTRVRGTIEIHGVRTVSLGGGWNVDGGWYQISGGTGPTLRGNYWLVAHAEAGGTPQIQWMVSNGRPVPGGPAGS